MPGMKLNVASLALSASDARGKEVWMDPAVWGTLPEPLVELVLVHLPLPQLLPMRAVCKGWNDLLQSSAFLTAQRHRAVQCPPYVVTVNEPACNAFSFFQTGPELYYLRSAALYCPVGKNWFNMSLDWLPFRDLYVTSVAGGLLCFVAYKGATGVANREVVLGVCNPATRTWRLLPGWGGVDNQYHSSDSSTPVYNLPVFVAMVVDNFRRSYKVVVIDHDRAVTRCYHSTSMAWTETESVPCRHSFPYYDRTPTSPAVVSNGTTLVCATQCKTGISSYDLETGLWESHHVFLPGMHSNVHLVQHLGRILMVSRIMKAKYEGSDRVQVSELDPKGLRLTTPLDDVPLGPSKQFLDHFKVSAYRSVDDDSDGLCFVSATTGERWLYDLENRFWHILPSSPGISKSKSMVAYGGFSVHLRVDIQP